MNRFEAIKSDDAQGGFTVIDRSAERGFTLIELSIVLVIIGLIVGGVLVGQDLIRAAEIRATIGQIEKYNTAVNTFRTKYNGIPGDLVSPTNFGMTATDANNKGNGFVESCTANAGVNMGCENMAFWNHLSTANLVDGSFTATTATTGFSAMTVINTTYVPAAKMGRGNYIMIGLLGSADTIPATITSSLNYFMIAGPTAASGAGQVTASNRMTPTEAYQIDTKLDDSSPTTGVVQEYDGYGATSITRAGASTTVCMSSTTTYNIANQPSGQLCSLAIRAAF